jgi:chemotaxis protein methyltransferase CheR
MVRGKMADFFCDPDQLKFLVQSALPELLSSYGYGVRRKLMLWSVGCSHGEEPYTLAMVLSEFSERYPGLDFDFQILATDAAPGALQIAERGIYHEDEIVPIPVGFRKKYLLRSRDREKNLIRIACELRELVKFRNIDFEEENLKFRESIDVIFCRDLLDRVGKTVRADILHQFYRHLSPGGYLFVGQSVLPGELSIPVISVGSAIYRKTGGDRA